MARWGLVCAFLLLIMPCVTAIPVPRPEDVPTRSDGTAADPPDLPADTANGGLAYNTFEDAANTLPPAENADQEDGLTTSMEENKDQLVPGQALDANEKAQADDMKAHLSTEDGRSDVESVLSADQATNPNDDEAREEAAENAYVADGNDKALAVEDKELVHAAAAGEEKTASALEEGEAEVIAAHSSLDTATNGVDGTETAGGPDNGAADGFVENGAADRAMNALAGAHETSAQSFADDTKGTATDAADDDDDYGQVEREETQQAAQNDAGAVPAGDSLTQMMEEADPVQVAQEERMQEADKAFLVEPEDPDDRESEAKAQPDSNALLFPAGQKPAVDGESPLADGDTKNAAQQSNDGFASEDNGASDPNNGLSSQVDHTPSSESAGAADRVATETRASETGVTSVSNPNEPSQTDIPAEQTDDAPAEETDDAAAEEADDAPAEETDDAAAEEADDAPAEEADDAPAEKTDDAPASKGQWEDDAAISKTDDASLDDANPLGDGDSPWSKRPLNKEDLQSNRPAQGGDHEWPADSRFDTGNAPDRELENQGEKSMTERGAAEQYPDETAGGHDNMPGQEPEQDGNAQKSDGYNNAWQMENPERSNPNGWRSDEQPDAGRPDMHAFAVEKKFDSGLNSLESATHAPIEGEDELADEQSSTSSLLLTLTVFALIGVALVYQRKVRHILGIGNQRAGRGSSNYSRRQHRK